MTSKSLSSMVILSKYEQQAMLKLVQMITHDAQFRTINKDMWIDYCMTAFGWERSVSENIVHKLRRMANRELAK